MLKCVIAFRPLVRAAEIRNSNIEIRNKLHGQNINDQNRKIRFLSALVLNFEHSDFDIVSDFDIRIFFVTT